VNRRPIVRAFVAGLALTSGLALTTNAWAHPRVSPAVLQAKSLQTVSLAVPTENANVFTTKVELTLPSGFSIDSFVPSPGWKRSVQQKGNGDNAVIEKVTWSGGHVPTGEDAFFQFLAQPTSSKTYTFKVQQTYSDGSIVNWSGPESSDNPAPTIEAKSSLGGGGNSTLAIVALAVAAVAAVLGIAALLAGQGERALA
jgi:uncharacterized protein YcnI